MHIYMHTCKFVKKIIVLTDFCSASSQGLMRGLQTNNMKQVGTEKITSGNAVDKASQLNKSAPSTKRFDYTSVQERSKI